MTEILNPEPTPDTLVGASVWEHSLYHHLVSHEREEQEVIAEYREAALESGSRAFAYLAALIEEDETRHHRLLSDLAQSLRADAECRREEPRVPRMDGWGGDPHRLVTACKRLSTHEKSDLRAIRRIRKELEDVKDTTLWSLVLRLMELDTKKHLEILEFVSHHARR